jgi:hypothetical protein
MVLTFFLSIRSRLDGQRNAISAGLLVEPAVLGGAAEEHSGEFQYSQHHR